MKVVLFCGGLGTRLREHSETIPKPLVPVGPRPIIWHLMRYYAHFGHNDFVLCLGYGGNLIREYFIEYKEWYSNDFTMSAGGRRIELHSSDIDDWTITFVETGLHANIGERLLAVRHVIEGEDVFLANYSDGLADINLSAHIAEFERSGAVASFAAVRPSQSLHAIEIGADSKVLEIVPVGESGILINGGFFVLDKRIFKFINKGDELVEAPFRKLIQEKQLLAHRHVGFWAAMDTFKDKIRFDRMYARGNRPWEIWNNSA